MEGCKLFMALTNETPDPQLTSAWRQRSHERLQSQVTMLQDTLPSRGTSQHVKYDNGTKRYMHPPYCCVVPDQGVYRDTYPLARRHVSDCFKQHMSDCFTEQNDVAAGDSLHSLCQHSFLSDRQEMWPSEVLRVTNCCWPAWKKLLRRPQGMGRHIANIMPAGLI